MSRRRAWILASIASAALVALVIGVGAATGEFGFGGGQQGAQAEGTQPAPASQPLRADFIVDTQQQPVDSGGGESHGDDSHEHEQGDHQGEHEGDFEGAGGGD